MDNQTMTKGNIWKQLIIFSIPLLIGNIFQQLYNTVDSVIVGNYVGKEALAAVGSSAMIINMLVGFFWDYPPVPVLSFHNILGAKDSKRLHHSVHTAIAMTFYLGIVLTVLGIVLSPTLLRFMKTPEMLCLMLHYI